MEPIIRDVQDLESDERRVYESVVGHVLRDNQRIVSRVIEFGDEAGFDLAGPFQPEEQSRPRTTIQWLKQPAYAASVEGLRSND